LGDYEADIFRHLDAAEDVMAENSSEAVKCESRSKSRFQALMQVSGDVSVKRLMRFLAA
jgi:hypothetical protein